MMKPRISLFAEHEREDPRGRIGDPLVGLANARLRRTGRQHRRCRTKAVACQRRPSAVFDFANGQNLGAPAALQSGRRRAGRSVARPPQVPAISDLTESSIPDAKMIWLFRDLLTKAGAGTLVFEQV